MAYKTGWLKKIINGASTKIFAFAHVKTVYYNYSQSKTLKTKLDEMDSSISGKAASGHTHDDRYYTESEINTKLNGKASSSHTHTKSQITDFPSSMPASDVYSWAKAASKPSYSASEVGAAPTSNPVFTGSISLGRKSGTTIGENSIAIGENTEASGLYSTAFGKGRASGKHAVACGGTAKGNVSFTANDGTADDAWSFAEGFNTNASGKYSYAGGLATSTNGECAYARGYGAKALAYQYAIGHFNTDNLEASNSMGTGTGTAFVIGNGLSYSRSNAFRVNDNGMPYSKAALNTSGCDYAEFFEWQDGNENNEDRRGYFVTLDGKYIKIADAGDWVLGIVSGFPSIIGNGDEEWKGRYVFDDFGTPVTETFEYEVDEFETITNDDGEEEIITKKVKKTGTKWKEVPEYDPTQTYIERLERKEWSAIGMLGVLSVRDDGTCQVNGFCKLADGGIATASDKGYRVVKRVTDNIVEVVLK